MSHVVRVPIPDEWFDQLAAYAKQCGQTPESLLLALAANVVQPQQVLPLDSRRYPPTRPYAC